LNRPVFVIASIGASIGVGNIWKFPYLTMKHGGATFIICYIIALLILAIPMLILELTLGQKMQKGSVGALRGIVPKLGGVGWGASMAGFVIAIIYNVWLGLCAIYLVKSGSSPWTFGYKDRPMSCQQGSTISMKSEELYFYMNTTHFVGE
jgi:solute carrier family 6 amino acid/orphan transporter-like 15/16/17/18/20